MPNEDKTAGDLNYADTLWKAADTLRGQVDAAEYKHVVLGLLFLKYISDSFETRREALKTELDTDGIKGKQLENLLESRDGIHRRTRFLGPSRVPLAKPPEPGHRPRHRHLIDDAILAVERDNLNLKGKLPRDYARRGIEPVRMQSLIDVIAGISFKGSRDKARDMLGRVYEYFIGKFAAAEGKLGGEFYTPRSVVRVLVEMIEPYQGRIYEPACGAGGMFVQSEKFVEARGGQRTDVSIFGQESNPTTWRLAHMNLAIHGIEAKLGEQPADTFLRDQDPDLKADFVLANPPFNVSDWSGQLLRGDVRWKYGDPPVGNANYAWIQHFIHHLAYPNGRGGGVAGFVIANGRLSSNTGGEGDIRRKVVEADLVDCIVALPRWSNFSKN
jgi:type I restriction enzyme M protein